MIIEFKKIFYRNMINSVNVFAEIFIWGNSNEALFNKANERAKNYVLGSIWHPIRIDLQYAIEDSIKRRLR